MTRDPSSNEPLVKAVGYVRCSTEMQEDSPEQQKKEILAFAARRGYSIVDWFVDFGKSGTTFEERPSWQRLRATVEAGATFRAVICYDESRWGRAINSEENTYWRVHFLKKGVDVVLVKTSIDPEHEYAPMLKAFEGIQASQYSKKLSELTLRGAMNNDKYSSGGTAPYGYRRIATNLKTGVSRPLDQGEWCVRKQEKVTLALGDEEEVKTVRFIFERRAEGMACVLIAKALNDASVECAKRGKWRNLDRKWSAGTIKSMLENPAYYGARAYNRFSTSKIIARQKGRPVRPYVSAPAWKNPEDEWRLVEGAHPAIISKELWTAANATNKVHARSKPNGHTYHSRFLLTGLIKCAKCGFAFQGWSGKVRGKEYLRYIDGGYQMKRVCDFFSIPRDEMEAFALKAIKETISDPRMVTQIEECLRELIEADAQGEGTVKKLQAELKEIDRKSRNLIRLAEDGNLESEHLALRLRELESQKATLLRSIANKDGRPQSRPSLNIGQEVARFLLNFEREFENAPIHEKKLLVQKCISQIVVDKEKGVARFFVRKIPAVTPQIEELLYCSGSQNPVMSNRCARNRT
jgi:DNA invertase Pin-like site-specific DNA recombinase